MPKRFGTEYRNRWMIKESDYIVTYVNRHYGGAAKFKDYGKKRGKVVIEV